MRTTREKLFKLTEGEVLYDTEFKCKNIEGHPDAITKTQIFEIKTSGKVKESWNSWLIQAFSYAAMAEKGFTKLYIVLPLQEHIQEFDLVSWKNRDSFKGILEKYKYSDASCIYNDFFIGVTLSKGDGVYKTVSDMIRRYPQLIVSGIQVYFNGNTSLKTFMPDDDIAKLRQIVEQTKMRIFVHSPYTINLCNEPETRDNFGVVCLKKQLDLAVACGFQGVVVHVGKSLKLDKKIALEYMRDNIISVLEHATEECPLILETPAGQGTETLTEASDFTDFCNEVNSIALSLNLEAKRLQICVDTCHVFACGHNPLEYIKHVLENTELCMKMIHYNDSSVDFGSRKDRHACLGTGMIDIQILYDIAKI